MELFTMTSHALSPLPPLVNKAWRPCCLPKVERLRQQASMVILGFFSTGSVWKCEESVAKKTLDELNCFQARWDFLFRWQMRWVTMLHSHSVCMRSSPSVVPSPFSVFLLSCYYFPFVVLIACQMLSLRRMVNLNLHAPAPPSSLFLVCEHVSVVCNFFSYVRFMWHGSSSLPSHNWSV